MGETSWVVCCERLLREIPQTNYLKPPQSLIRFSSTGNFPISSWLSSFRFEKSSFLHTEKDLVHGLFLFPRKHFEQINETGPVGSQCCCSVLLNFT